MIKSGAETWKSCKSKFSDFKNFTHPCFGCVRRALKCDYYTTKNRKNYTAWKTKKKNYLIYSSVFLTSHMEH